ncbi:glycosyltransferase [Riemerella anatipestifer]|uniref:glycosyltransferase family 2 protein n=1 Tax=Riemerella anatipestifer TaxID=34085 RepID=UPI0012AD8590|nr:glycosyltransferase [Riemerella anatipestifer]USL95940.1 glycosyltransferase [Riemerella anatipestifer]
MDVGQGENPLISVIVPVYNAENYVEECLQSISNQTYRNIEIIVINDGSTDNSGAICDRYAMTDSRVRVIHKSNGGLSNTRNVGIENAKGIYFSFIDSDDIIHPQFLEILYNLIQKTKSSVSCCKYYMFSDYAEISGVFNATKLLKEETSFEVFTRDEFFATLYNKVYHVNNVITCNKLYSHSLFKELRFREKMLHEDEFLFNDLYGNRGLEFNVVYTHDEPLYFYRRVNNSITNTKMNLKKMLSLMQLYKEREVLFYYRGDSEMHVILQRRAIGIIKKMLQEGCARGLVQNLTINDYKQILTVPFLKVIERVKLVVLIFYKALLNK